MKDVLLIVFGLVEFVGRLAVLVVCAVLIFPILILLFQDDFLDLLKPTLWEKIR